MQEGIVALRSVAMSLAAVAALALGGCASSLDAVPPISDTASFADVHKQVIRNGDSLRVVVFGREALSGTYALKPDGTLQLASLGNIRASGLTPEELEQEIARKLAENGIDNARVSVMID